MYKNIVKAILGAFSRYGDLTLLLHTQKVRCGPGLTARAHLCFYSSFLVIRYKRQPSPVLQKCHFI